MSENFFSYPTLFGQPPLVIAHRGASGERPEHTLPAYRRAIAAGADFIEPDLVVTKDGVLVARHENALAQINSQAQIIAATTNVAECPQFRDRLTTKIIDGQKITGWFSEDFTVAELKTLQARERLPQLRGTEFDRQGLKILTLIEIIQLVQETEIQTGRKIGIYPETKHPSYFACEGTYLDGTTINVSLEELLIETLIAENFLDPQRIFIQSFEVGNLQLLRDEIMPKAGIDLPLVQLISDRGAPYDFIARGETRTYQDLITPSGLAEIAVYAVAIGASKRLVLPVNQDNYLLEPTLLIRNVHAAGLLLHVYTLRNETVFLAQDYADNPEAEVKQLIELGVDGYFTDFPATGTKVKINFLSRRHP